MNELALNSLARLRSLTPARVGLGRTGASARTGDLLDFQRAHALARDAVHAHLEAAALSSLLARIAGREVLRLHSMAGDRRAYLQRPDLGRKLDDAGRALLGKIEPDSYEVAFIVADGLSALAIERHAPPLLQELLPLLAGWSIAPICMVEQGRVAIGDEIAAALDARLGVVLIGERPGLSSPDSLGAYITWNPQPGRTDAERNCISNIREEGLGYVQAAQQLLCILEAARELRLTGVNLKMDVRRIGEGPTCLPS